MNNKKFLKCIVYLLCMMFSTSYAISARESNNICRLWHANPHWHYSALRASSHWKIPVSILMATIYQESRFHAYAHTPNSTAFGFAQVLNKEWLSYRQQRGVPKARRDNFNSSIDFIGWYYHYIVRNRAVSPYNAEQLYLYYRLGAFYHKLLHIPHTAQKEALHVAHIAEIYKRQQRSCGALHRK